MDCLKTEKLTIGYKGKAILTDLNIAFKKGEVVCLLGPNGTGKSTLLKTLSNMLPTLSGEVYIFKNKQKIPLQSIHRKDLAQHISIVLTEKLPSSNFTVYDIVSLGRVPYTNWLGNLSDKDTQIINNSIKMLGISSFKNRPIDSLSDGEKQRVMFAKALAQDTDIIILDEPTAHLDIVHRAELLSLLKKLAKKTNKAILISTHELDMAIQTADNIWLINKKNEFIVNSPEDLILSGEFSNTFSGKQIIFDEKVGVFKMNHKSTKSISLEGEGNRFYWTKHALEKKQYALTSDNPVKIIVKNDSWELHSINSVKHLKSISDLMKELI